MFRIIIVALTGFAVWYILRYGASLPSLTLSVPSLPRLSLPYRLVNARAHVCDFTHDAYTQNGITTVGCSCGNWNTIAYAAMNPAKSVGIKMGNENGKDIYQHSLPGFDRTWVTLPKKTQPKTAGHSGQKQSKKNKGQKQSNNKLSKAERLAKVKQARADRLEKEQG